MYRPLVLFAAVVTVRAHNSFFLGSCHSLGMFFSAASIWHSLFLDLYICDHRHVQTCPGMTRLYAPRGSNCGSPGVAKGRGSSLALLERDLPSSLLPLLTIVLPTIVSCPNSVLRRMSVMAHAARCHGGSRFGCENSPNHTHATYHLCMVAERLV